MTLTKTPTVITTDNHAALAALLPESVAARLEPGCVAWRTPAGHPMVIWPDALRAAVVRGDTVELGDLIEVSEAMYVQLDRDPRVFLDEAGEAVKVARLEAGEHVLRVPLHPAREAEDLREAIAILAEEAGVPRSSVRVRREGARG